MSLHKIVRRLSGRGFVALEGVPLEPVDYHVEVEQELVSSVELGRMRGSGLRSLRRLTVQVTACQRDSSLPVGPVLTLHLADGRYLRGAFRGGGFIATSDIEGP
jgi:hypothetical protein